MLLSECKRAALALCDELSDSGTPPYTGDADLVRKLSIFITQGLVILSQRKKRLKSAVYVTDGGQAAEYDLPTDYYQLVTIEGAGAHLTRGGRLAVDGDGSRTVWYNAWPAAVTASTPENTVLDADEDAATALPFYVASMVLLSAGDANWVNLQARFDSMVSSLESGPRAPGVRLVLPAR